MDIALSNELLLCLFRNKLLPKGHLLALIKEKDEVIKQQQDLIEALKKAAKM